MDTMEHFNINYDRFELHKLNPDCIYCGGPIKISGRQNIDWNIDHIFPKALFKWTSCPEDLIMQKVNVTLTHPSCNLAKGAHVLSNRQLDNLYMYKGHNDALHKLRDELQPYIQEYLDMIKTVYKRQKKRCGRCGRHAKPYELTLRRYNLNDERVLSNSILLCSTCSWNWRYITFNQDTMNFKG